MRAKLFLALLFVSLLWAGTRALGQETPKVQNPLPQTVLERCTLPEQQRREQSERETENAFPAKREARMYHPACRIAAAAPVRNDSYYRVAYQAFYLSGKAG